MPGKIRSLSGNNVMKILERFGFKRVQQRGSHVKVRWMNDAGQRVTISAPLYKSIKRGTLQSIFPDACRAVSDAELRSHFYHDS